MVTDEEILAAYNLMARKEGVFAEPASCATIAGLIKFKDMVKAGSKVVCILTGNGLKDPNSAIEHSGAKINKTSAKIDDIIKVMNI